MTKRAQAIWIMLCAFAAAAGAARPSALAQTLLHRQYHGGETLSYRMGGLNESWHYTIRANGVVKKDAAGTFYEEYQWSHMVSDGKPADLSPQTSSFRQRVSLDPAATPSLPDLSKVDPKLIGPITDFMTFYSDLWLAIKTGQLKAEGDHFYFKNGVPHSWADGTYVLLGESSIDFDFTLKSVNARDHTATLLIRHVPPAEPGVKTPAPWMRTPVTAGTPNNWVTVQKTSNGKYTAAAGNETFDVTLVISLADGRIVRGSLDNVVKTITRDCDDQALTACAAPQPHEVERKIEIELLP
jgi:hypothetical protein